MFVAAICVGWVYCENILLHHFLHSISQGAFCEMMAGKQVFEGGVQRGLIINCFLSHHMIDVSARRCLHVREIVKFPHVQSCVESDQCCKLFRVNFVI